MTAAAETTTRIDESIRAIIDLRDRTLQKSRIAFGNRVDADERGADTMSPDARAIVDKWAERFEEMEREADRDIARLVRGNPVVETLVGLKGIGYLLAAKMVAMIDISRADSISALWRYSGYGVTEGSRDKPTKGERLRYNIRLKTTLYLVAGSFMKCNSPYRAIYDSARAYYEAHRTTTINPETGQPYAWTKAHIHAAAMRKMIKIFLSHLWIYWRELEGLPTREPYAHDKLGHTGMHEAADFGWPAPGA